MTGLFLRLFNIGVTAGWIVLAVLGIKLLFRKLPKWISCLLWGIVALRLLLPFTLESPLSLLPSPELIPQDIAVSQTPAIQSGIPAVNRVVNPLFATVMAPDSVSLEGILFWVSIIWLAGTLVILTYGIFSYLRLCRQVRAGIPMEDNVYFCDDIDSPFLLGILRPRIYLPSGLEAGMLPQILAHEQAHIRRLDHWWKPLGFLLLSIYWFNPLLWLGYILLCRDIESACDEKVIKGTDKDFRLQYMEALLACSLHRRMILTCPVAFGEVSVKDRIKGIARYKRPTLWLTLASLLLCGLVTVCFLTTPRACAHAYTQEVTLAPTCTSQGIQIRQCTDCGHKVREQLPLAPHTPGELVTTKEPNCTYTGAVASVCQACRVTFIAQVLPTNGVHNIQRTVTTAPTCTEPGAAVDRCIYCDHQETLVLEPAGHNYKTEIDAPGSCGFEGYQVKVCTDCGREIIRYTSSTGHNYNYSGICSTCGASKATYSHSATIPTTKPKTPTSSVIRWDP